MTTDSERCSLLCPVILAFSQVQLKVQVCRVMVVVRMNLLKKMPPAERGEMGARSL
jgi:hypothetical protein